MRNGLFCPAPTLRCMEPALLVYREQGRTMLVVRAPAALQVHAQPRRAGQRTVRDELRTHTKTLKKLQANTPSKLLHKASQVPKHIAAYSCRTEHTQHRMHTQQAGQKH